MLDKNLKITVLIVSLFFSFGFFSHGCAAQQSMPRTLGFSGYIELLGAYFSTNSQLVTNSDNRRTDSLNNSGKRTGAFRPIPMGLVNYTFADTRIQLYLGTLPEDVAQGQFQIEAGIRHWLKDGTRLSFALIPITPFANETWEDPFVVGINRLETDVQSYGFKIAADAVGGSGFGITYGFASRDVDEERSGIFLMSQPGSTLKPDDLDALRRDSDFHRLTVDYDYRQGQHLRFKPAMKYTRGDAKGDANSFHAYRPEISLRYFDNPFGISMTAAYNHEIYDKTHPVFDKTRQDHSLSLFAVFSYHTPFGLKNFRIDWFNFISRNDSNINFFDSSGYATALGIGYTFGTPPRRTRETDR